MTLKGFAKPFTYILNALDNYIQFNLKKFLLGLAVIAYGFIVTEFVFPGILGSLVANFTLRTITVWTTIKNLTSSMAAATSEILLGIFNAGVTLWKKITPVNASIWIAEASLALLGSSLVKLSWGRIYSFCKPWFPSNIQQPEHNCSLVQTKAMQSRVLRQYRHIPKSKHNPSPISHSYTLYHSRIIKRTVTASKSNPYPRKKVKFTNQIPPLLYLNNSKEETTGPSASPN